jgi:hypothetical protein
MALRRLIDFTDPAPVRMVDRFFVRSAALEGHDEGVDDQIGVG